MIHVKIKDDSYHVPTKWAEITFRQYVDLNATEDSSEIFSIATGIPLETIQATEEDQLQKLVVILGFLQVPLNIEGYEPPERIDVGGVQIDLVKDIREKSFGQKIYFHETMKQCGQNVVPSLPEIVSIYAQPYFSGPDFNMDKAELIIPLLEDVFFVDLYSTAISYIEQLKSILEDEAKTLSSKPDPLQVEAGVDMFNQFGVMNTIKALANNDITKYAEVEKIEYNTAFVHMRMNKVQNDFNDNYRKVMEQTRNRNAK